MAAVKPNARQRLHLGEKALVKRTDSLETADPVQAPGCVAVYPHCRICWAPGDAECGGQLVSPCHCTGSVRYIHVRCLRQWQRTLRSQGAAHKAQSCDLCCARYQVPYAGPRWLRCQPAGGHLKTAAWVVCETWQFAVLAGGVVQGLRCGWAGMLTGASCSWRHVGGMAGSLAHWAPELFIAAVLAPRLQVPFINGALLFGAAAVGEVAAVTTICTAVASVAGLVSGSTTVVAWSCLRAVKCGRWGFFRLRRSLGGIFRVVRAVLRDGLPAATIIVGAVTLH